MHNIWYVDGKEERGPTRFGMIGGWWVLRGKGKTALALDFPADWGSAQRSSNLDRAWRILVSASSFCWFILKRKNLE